MTRGYVNKSLARSHPLDDYIIHIDIVSSIVVGILIARAGEMKKWDLFFSPWQKCQNPNRIRDTLTFHMLTARLCFSLNRNFFYNVAGYFAINSNDIQVVATLQFNYLWFYFQWTFFRMDLIIWLLSLCWSVHTKKKPTINRKCI